MSLRQDRCRFTECLASLIIEMVRRGYEVAIDEATEHLTAKDPTSDHCERSKHHEGLAADLNLYRNGTYLKKTEDHLQFGIFWESLHPDATWGGRWNDGNHYSWKEGKRSYPLSMTSSPAR